MYNIKQKGVTIMDELKKNIDTIVLLSEEITGMAKRAEQKDGTLKMYRYQLEAIQSYAKGILITTNKMKDKRLTNRRERSYK